MGTIALLVTPEEVKSNLLSHVQIFETPWTVAHQAPLSVGFSREEYWSGLPFPPPGDLPDPGIKLASPLSLALQADSLPAECFQFFTIEDNVCCGFVIYSFYYIDAQGVSGPSSSCVWNPRVFADDARGWQCPFVSK